MEKVTPGFVVACDGEAHSVNAARLASKLAKATGQPVKLLTVFPRRKVETLVASGVFPRELKEEVQQYGRKVFDAAKEGIDGTVGPIEEILLSGDAAEQILDYLEKHPEDHLVLGRRGHSRIRSLTLGSVSEKVIRHATAAVTVVSK